MENQITVSSKRVDDLPLKKQRPKGDIPLLVAVAATAAFGVLMVYSASCYNAEVQYGNRLYFVTKQAIGFVFGLGAMIFMCLFPYTKLKKLKWVALAVSLILLALVFIPGLGKSAYGATRWISIGPLTIQPSEIAKYGFILFSAAYISDRPEKVKSFVGILPVLGAGLAICGLIILEPNMSITMCVALLMLCIVFVSGTSLKVFAMLLIPFLIAIPVLIALEPYRLNRLSAFLNPWASPQDEGYQLIQSLYALGNGGWFGTGLFNSTQKFRFLPFAESDFILAIIGEEFGVVGITVLFAVSGFIIWRGVKIALRCDNFFGYILAVGITAIYAIQTLVNGLVVTGSIPPTGLPLPLISSGNTALIITMAATGILYNISASNPKKKKA